MEAGEGDRPEHQEKGCKPVEGGVGAQEYSSRWIELVYCKCPLSGIPGGSLFHIEEEEEGEEDKGAAGGGGGG